MNIFTNLLGAYGGRPIAVMGGAPCLPDDVERVSSCNPIWISANEHGAKLQPVDYIFAVDFMHQREARLMSDVLAPYETPVISRWGQYASYMIPAGLPKVEGNAGLQAIYYAFLMGAWPVIVTGIELYQGGTYYHDERAASSGHDKTADFWAQRLDALASVVPETHIRVASGPLTRYWKQYDPQEHMGEYVEHPIITHMRREHQALHVRFKNRMRLPSTRRVHLKGDVAWLPIREAHRLIGTRQVMEITA